MGMQTLAELEGGFMRTKGQRKEKLSKNRQKKRRDEKWNWEEVVELD